MAEPRACEPLSNHRSHGGDTAAGVAPEKEPHDAALHELVEETRHVMAAGAENQALGAHHSPPSEPVPNSRRNGTAITSVLTSATCGSR